MLALQYNVFFHNVDKLLMGDGGVRVGPPHCSCHFNSQLLMPDGGWEVGCILLIAHVTSTLNC